MSYTTPCKLVFTTAQVISLSWVGIYQKIRDHGCPCPVECAHMVVWRLLEQDAG